MRVRKMKVQNIEKKGKTSMAKIKSFKKGDKIKDLGDKICRYVEYVAEGKKGRALELAALTDILFSIREFLRVYNERLKKVEAKLGIYTEEEIKNFKVGGTDPD